MSLSVGNALMSYFESIRLVRDKIAKEYTKRETTNPTSGIKTTGDFNSKFGMEVLYAPGQYRAGVKEWFDKVVIKRGKSDVYTENDVYFAFYKHRQRNEKIIFMIWPDMSIIEWKLLKLNKENV